jgi:hypothetical protein
MRCVSSLCQLHPGDGVDHGVSGSWLRYRRTGAVESYMIFLGLEAVSVYLLVLCAPLLAAVSGG